MSQKPKKHPFLATFIGLFLSGVLFLLYPPHLKEAGAPVIIPIILFVLLFIIFFYFFLEDTQNK